MPKKILLLTFYYPPDLCAGSFRAGALVDALRKTHGSDIEIEVLTTMPNRYQSFQRSANKLETGEGIVVHRFDVHSHNSGFLDQSRSFVSYARQVLFRVFGQKYDLVFSTSSRLMTAALGAFVARRKKVRLYLDIRDLFTDTMNDVLVRWLKWFFVPIFFLAEKYTFRTASAINVVSPGFKEYFESRGYGKLLRFFTNGIDTEFLNYNFSKKGQTHEIPLILYAGNIGAGQGLDRIIPEAARLLRGTHNFRVIGDGGLKDLLVERCLDLENVRIEPPVDRETLKEAYAQADILLMHLNDFDAFKKVLPSKIFELAATGKPILAGVAGYAAKFTGEHVENAAVFRPCDARGLVLALGEIHMESSSRSGFKREYAREKIMQCFAEDLASLLSDQQNVADGA